MNNLNESVFSLNGKLLGTCIIIISNGYVLYYTMSGVMLYVKIPLF